ncbi:hypothetical protein M885DRAFT_594228 [Pelagophyceae sp. CCMP2097]|nr:hypothetical protein M885DRAFT_594228 [Pelagophyceae sp. CCMP2097]
MVECSDPRSPEATRLFREFEINVLQRASRVYGGNKQWSVVADGDDLVFGATAVEAALVRQYEELQSIDLDAFDSVAHRERMNEWDSYVRGPMAKDVRDSRALSKALDEEGWQRWLVQATQDAAYGPKRSWDAWLARDFVMAKLEAFFAGVSTGTQPSPEDDITFEALKKAGPVVWTLLLKAYTALLDGNDDRKDVWSSVKRPVSFLQDEANPGQDNRMQLMMAREILAYCLLGLGKKTWVLQIDIRRAFPSTIRAYALLAMRRSGLGGAWLAAFWRLQEAAGVKLSTAYGLYSEVASSARDSGRRRFGAGFQAEEVYVKIHKAVELVSALHRSHLRQTLDCFLRSTLEYPPGVMGGLSAATEAQVEAIYVKAMRLIFGAGVAVHFPHDVMREFMGEATLRSRRRAARAVFSGALAAISVRGPWAEALRCFRAYATPAYTKASVTWSMDATVRDLGLGQPTGAETKAEWKAVVHAAFRAAETTRRQDAISLMSSAFRLRTALQRDLVLGYAPLTQEWLHELVLSQRAGGGSMVLFSVLCGKHRLFPATRSFFPGGPAACYCDLCQSQLAVPADAAHFFLTVVSSTTSGRAGCRNAA